MISPERILELVKRPNAAELIEHELKEAFQEGFRSGQVSMRARITSALPSSVIESTWPIERAGLI